MLKRKVRNYHLNNSANKTTFPLFYKNNKKSNPTSNRMLMTMGMCFYLFIIKSEVWNINPCLGLSHALYVFLCSYFTNMSLLTMKYLKDRVIQWSTVLYNSHLFGTCAPVISMSYCSSWGTVWPNVIVDWRWLELWLHPQPGVYKLSSLSPDALRWHDSKRKLLKWRVR